MKKLQKFYQLYEEFTPEEAASRMSTNLGLLKAYLDYETPIKGSMVKIGVTPGKYMLINPFG